MRGISILYKGYVEANLIISDLLQYNEDLLFFLVISDHKYGDRVPVQIGTQVIDHLVATMTKNKLQQAAESWKQVHLSTIIWKRNTVKGLDVLEYDHKGTNGKIHTIREVVILPFGTTIVKDIIKLMTH